MADIGGSSTPLLPGDGASSWSRWWRRWRFSIPSPATNLRIKNGIWAELGGAVGDLGTYIPIVLALTLVNHLDLAMASRDMNSKEESFVMLVCAAVSMTGSGAALGFLCGIVLYVVLRLREFDFSGLFGPRTKDDEVEEN
ncbi:molybdate transporter 2 [Carex littledalei]|uniref:Molybdate transporter 2 n=1 Tax=Carex littledalei TaxID=544730 RepID=A0A833VGV8_9POAL|nr:molybdate transporter 2 [Carex littledalei]